MNLYKNYDVLKLFSENASNQYERSCKYSALKADCENGSSTFGSSTFGKLHNRAMGHVNL